MTETPAHKHNERVAYLIDAITSASANLQRGMPYCRELNMPVMCKRLEALVETLSREAGHARALLQGRDV